MHNISYFHRNSSTWYSIKAATDPYIDHIKKSNKVQEIYMPQSNASFISIIKNLHFAFVNRNLKGINHITGDIHYCSLVLPKNLTILTIHDLNGLVLKDYSFIKRYFYYIFWCYLPLYRAKYVTCISEKTKREIIGYFPFVSNKIIVIHNPINDKYNFVYKKFNEIKPVILHIGTRPIKNLERVIEALDGISSELRIIGKLNDYQKKMLHEHNIKYSNVYDISDNEMIDEYINSDIISFPSLYEGFGMPIIESQAIGRVVLTSNIEPLKEVAADAALFVDPNDVKSIRQGFETIIHSKQIREKLVSLGRNNILRFKSNYIARSYQNLYDIIAGLN